jgi:hypothetical protein
MRKRILACIGDEKTRPIDKAELYCPPKGHWGLYLGCHSFASLHRAICKTSDCLDGRARNWEANVSHYLWGGCLIERTNPEDYVSPWRVVDEAGKKYRFHDSFRAAEAFIRVASLGLEVENDPS